MSGAAVRLGPPDGMVERGKAIDLAITAAELATNAAEAGNVAEADRQLDLMRRHLGKLQNALESGAAYVSIA